MTKIIVELGCEPWSEECGDCRMDSGGHCEAFQKGLVAIKHGRALRCDACKASEKKAIGTP